MEPREDASLSDGTYELWQLQMKPNCTNWSQDMLTVCNSLQTENSQLFGAWQSVFGPLNSGIVLWRHSDIDKADSVSQQLLSQNGNFQ